MRITSYKHARAGEGCRVFGEPRTHATLRVGALVADAANIPVWIVPGFSHTHLEI